MLNRKKSLFIALLLLTLPALGHADTAGTANKSDPHKWGFSAGVYLWGASIGGDSANGGEIDVSFGDLLKNLDFAAMAYAGATKGKWTVATDLVYLNVEADNDGSFSLPVGPGLSVDTDGTLQLKAWVVTPTVQYRVIESDKLSLNATVGARFLWIDIGVEVKTATALGSRRVNASGAASVWDGVVGVKGQYRVNEKWYVPYYADLGTGQSDYTWQLFTGIGYRFKKVDALLGYRYLKWQFKGGGTLDDLDIRGPMLGIRYYF